MMASVKAEIKQELQEEEIRQILKEQIKLEEFHAAINETSDITNSIKETLVELPEKAQITADLNDESK
jgi:sec-independent protein translocase protein TatB